MTEFRSAPARARRGLSIGAKLCCVQAASATLFFLVSLVSVFAVRASDAAVARHGVELQRLHNVEQIAHLLAESRVADAYQAFGAGGGAALPKRPDRELSARFSALSALSTGTAIDARVGDLAEAWRLYSVEQEKLFQVPADRRDAPETRRLGREMDARYARIDATTHMLIADILGEAETAGRAARNLNDLMATVVVLVCGAGIAMALLILLFVRRRIVQRLRAITMSLSQLAGGNLDVPVSGGERRDEIGAMVRALEVFRSHARELDEAHRETQDAQSAAEAMARHDALTGLPNRRLFTEALERAIEDDGPCAVLLLDLDRFKPVNDIHGHDAGDAVLCAVADRFAAHRHELGTVARLGGDEFVVVLPVHGGTEEAARAARLIGRLVSEPVAVDGGFAELTATIGIALFPQDGVDPTSLLRAADLAMYQAKAEGRDTYRFFKASMSDRVHERAMLDADLRRAIMAGEIRPHYQPLVSIDDGELVGFEILSRWHHPEHGVIMPMVFIPAADERGLLGELTYRVLRQACIDSRNWPDHLRLSLNLSPGQIKDPKLASRILAILVQTGVAPSRLEIEITENALITDVETTRTVLASLQSLGMSIALDDFGTGYSSLYQLRDLKFDKIKIDKSFVHELDHGQDNAAIVQAMIGLSKSLGLATTAEGIEDASQWDSLSSWGCDYGQGYLFGKAMTAEQADALVSAPLSSQKLAPRGARRLLAATPRLAHA